MLYVSIYDIWLKKGFFLDQALRTQQECTFKMTFRRLLVLYTYDNYSKIITFTLGLVNSRNINSSCNDYNLALIWLYLVVKCSFRHNTNGVAT